MSNDDYLCSESSSTPDWTFRIGLETFEQIHLAENKKYLVERTDDVFPHDAVNLYYDNNKNIVVGTLIIGNFNEVKTDNILKGINGHIFMYYHHKSNLCNGSYIYWFYDQIKK